MKLDKLNLSRRDILVGLVILAVLAGLVYYFKGKSAKNSATLPSIETTEKALEDRFRMDIPDDVEKTELKDVSGGTGGGIATRTEILADLPEPAPGSFYQGWLENAGKLISLGKLRVAKGGYLLEYDSTRYPGYDKVLISLEKVFDGKLETSVLEGSF